MGLSAVKKSQMRPATAKMAILIAAALALACKLALALNTYGSNDVLTWERHLARITQDGAMAWYREGVEVPIPNFGTVHQAANHPPLVILLMELWGSLARVSGLPFGFWLRVIGAVADIGSLLLVWKILGVSGLGARSTALLLVALSPVSIMVSGFHGNTDPVMVLFVLASVYLVESGRPPWLAGTALGLAVSVKIVALLFAPVFLLYLPGVRRRAEFTFAAATTAILAALPYLARDPVLILKSTFGYSSTPEHWGLSQIAATFLPGGAYAAYRAMGGVLAVAPVLWASFWMNRRPRKPALFSQCGCVAFLFLFLAPGFGVQYLAWLVPWGAGLSDRKVLPYYAASGAFLFACYTTWSGGLPWYLANSFSWRAAFWPRLIRSSLDITCWMSVGAVVYAYWQDFCPRRGWNGGTTMPDAARPQFP